MREQFLQRIFFMVNFSTRTNSKSAQNGQWRAPAFHAMLKQEQQYDRWHGKAPLVDGNPQCQAREGQGRCIDFQNAFNIPFLVQFLHPVLDGRGTAVGITLNTAFGLNVNLLVQINWRRAPDAVGTGTGRVFGTR